MQVLIALVALLTIDPSLSLKIEPVRWLENKTLECFDLGTNNDFQHWILPTEDILTGSVAGEYTVDTSTGALTILNADGQDTGVYRCVYIQPDGTYSIKSIQIDVWDYTAVINAALDWETNLIRGIIVGAVCIVIFVGYWLLHEWQWVAPSDFGTDAIYEKHAVKPALGDWEDLREAHSGKHEMKHDGLEMTEIPLAYENVAFEADTVTSRKSSSAGSRKSSAGRLPANGRMSEFDD